MADLAAEMANVLVRTSANVTRDGSVRIALSPTVITSVTETVSVFPRMSVNATQVGRVVLVLTECVRTTAQATVCVWLSTRLTLPMTTLLLILGNGIVLTKCANLRRRNTLLLMCFLMTP